MYHPEGSNLNITSELLLFNPPIVESGVESTQYIEYLPANQLSEEGPIEISIPSSGAMYIDLSRSRLHVKAKIVQKNGSDLTANDIVSPANLFLHSLWRQIDVYLQQKLISSTGTNYSYKSMIDTLLTKGTDHHNSKLQCQLFFKDTAGTHDNTSPTQTPLNQGLIRRYLLSSLSKTFDMEGKIFSDIFNTDKFLMKSVELRIKLWQNKNEFRLMATDATKGYKIVLNEVSLKVCYVNVMPGVIVGHSEVLKSTNAKYRYNQSDIKTFTVGSGQFNFSFDNIFQNNVPSKLILAMVGSSTYSGNYTKSPFKFDHYNLDFIGAYINGESKPSKPLQLNFSNEKGQNNVSAYQTLFSGTDSTTSGNIPISRSDYPSGYTLIVFDFDQHINQREYFPLVRKGNVRVEGHFKEALREIINIIIYGCFPSILEIDSA